MSDCDFEYSLLITVLKQQTITLYLNKRQAKELVGWLSFLFPVAHIWKAVLKLVCHLPWAGGEEVKCAAGLGLSSLAHLAWLYGVRSDAAWVFNLITPQEKLQMCLMMNGKKRSQDTDWTLWKVKVVWIYWETVKLDCLHMQTDSSWTSLHRYRMCSKL